MQSGTLVRVRAVLTLAAFAAAALALEACKRWL